MPTSLKLFRIIAAALLCGLLASPILAQAPDDNPVVQRFAVLGDAEPKPEAAFPGVEAAVADINVLATRGQLDFVIGVGDIAHKATMIQYENVTPVLQELNLPFYPIMGNEEHHGPVGLFLEFANRWNDGRVEIEAARYVLETEPVALVMASPDFDREFNDDGIAWMVAEIQRLAPQPVFLVVHGAQTGVYPENADKGVSHAGFAEVVAQPNLAAVISGDLHMDMDRVDHSKRIDEVHYLHIPALERTKIPDETRHVPMFRVVSVHQDGQVQVETYEVGTLAPLERHDYRFTLPQG